MARPEVAVTFPEVFRQKFRMGYSYLPERNVSVAPDVASGTDEYGWGADARRMANERVRQTRVSQDRYNHDSLRATNSRVAPITALGHNRPFGIAVSQPSFSGDTVSRLRGGVFTTMEGQQYGRKLLEKRAQQLEEMGLTESAEPVVKVTDVPLTEVEGMKDESTLLFDALIDELQTGTVKDSRPINDWWKSFREVLPFYSRSDEDDLVKIVRTLEESLGYLDAIGENATKAKNKRLADFIQLRVEDIIKIVKEYMKKALDLPNVEDRRTLLKAEIRKSGLDKAFRQRLEAPATDQPRVDEPVGADAVAPIPLDLEPNTTLAQISDLTRRVATNSGISTRQALMQIATANGYLPRNADSRTEASIRSGLKRFLSGAEAE